MNETLKYRAENGLIFDKDGEPVADCHIAGLPSRKAIGRSMNLADVLNARSRQAEQLETTNRALIEALEEAESVMAKNIYPKPDAPDDHPWRVLERVRAALKQVDVSAIAERNTCELESKYYELIYSVHNKFPGESRHETALRYIRQQEDALSGPQADSGQAKGESDD